jgi:hypothetical protein
MSTFSRRDSLQWPRVWKLKGHPGISLLRQNMQQPQSPFVDVSRKNPEVHCEAARPTSVARQLRDRVRDFDRYRLKCHSFYLFHHFSHFRALTIASKSVSWYQSICLVALPSLTPFPQAIFKKSTAKISDRALWNLKRDSRIRSSIQFWQAQIESAATSNSSIQNVDVGDSDSVTPIGCKLVEMYRISQSRTMRLDDSSTARTIMTSQLDAIMRNVYKRSKKINTPQDLREKVCDMRKERIEIESRVCWRMQMRERERLIDKQGITNCCPPFYQIRIQIHERGAGENEMKCMEVSRE